MGAIKLIKGDLTEFPAGVQAIMHGCNTLQVMGGGLALQIAKKYPMVAGVDKLFASYLKAQGKVPKIDMLGDMSYSVLDDKPRIVFNLYQQSQLGEGSLSYDSLRSSMRKAMRFSSILGVEKVGLPYKIGCGLAGGDWEKVFDIIADCREIFDGDIYIIEYFV